jgi:hypothetical protein
VRGAAGSQCATADGKGLKRHKLSSQRPQKPEAPRSDAGKATEISLRIEAEKRTALRRAAENFREARIALLRGCETGLASILDKTRASLNTLKAQLNMVLYGPADLTAGEKKWGLEHFPLAIFRPSAMKAEDLRTCIDCGAMYAPRGPGRNVLKVARWCTTAGRTHTIGQRSAQAIEPRKASIASSAKNWRLDAAKMCSESLHADGMSPGAVARKLG